MKQKINISLSEEVLLKAKQIARKRNSTVSSLIESELIRLIKQEESCKKLFSEYLKDMPTPKNDYAGHFDFKKVYMEEKFTPGLPLISPEAFLNQLTINQ